LLKEEKVVGTGLTRPTFYIILIMILAFTLNGEVN